ncbi:MAG TPA: hypothetical protein PLQ93_08140 [Bacteroidia bacterium]|nr:hypothetical protein [Bacteroidia bacterium]
MKNLILIAGSICLMQMPLNLPSQNLDEIIAKHIEAVGGTQNWSKLKSLRTESIMKVEGAEIRFVTTSVDKTASRQEIMVMGMTGYTLLKSNEGWNYMPWMGQQKAEAMTADDVKNAQDDLYLQDDFMTYKEQGKSIEYFGMDDVDGTECHKIKMTGKEGKETTYYIDPDNFLVIKQTDKTLSNGQERENSTFFSDYKKLDEGLVYPMSSSGGWGEINITKMDINPKVDESLFKVSSN